MKTNLLRFTIEHSIKCRKEVLEDFKKYNIDEKHRPNFEKNLKYFEDRLKEIDNG